MTGDLESHPGVWHGMAEGHTMLPCADRLKMALKACDLYLNKVEELEQLLMQYLGREQT